MINIKFKELLGYYDIPIAFTSEDISTKELYLCYAINYNDSGIEYYAVKISEEELLAIKQGDEVNKYYKSDRDVFQFFLGGSPNEIKQIKKIEKNDIKYDFLSSNYSVG
jgi:hypothetical protein